MCPHTAKPKVCGCSFPVPFTHAHTHTHTHTYVPNDTDHHPPSLTHAPTFPLRQPPTSPPPHLSVLQLLRSYPRPPPRSYYSLLFFLYMPCLAFSLDFLLHARGADRVRHEAIVPPVHEKKEGGCRIGTECVKTLEKTLEQKKKEKKEKNTDEEETATRRDQTEKTLRLQEFHGKHTHTHYHYRTKAKKTIP